MLVKRPVSHEFGDDVQLVSTFRKAEKSHHIRVRR
jgi:hypothetical protein